MKQFLLLEFGLGLTLQRKWQRAGFSIYQSKMEGLSDCMMPDIVWIGKTTKKPSQGVSLSALYPKLFFLHSSATSLMPPHWQAYTRQTVQVAGTEWIVGSKLEEPLPTAVTEYLAQQKTAELAAVLYIVILESVFRETAEWCGHMSSVVGRI